MSISPLDNIAFNYSDAEYLLAEQLFDERVVSANWMLSMASPRLFEKSTLIDIGSGQGSLLYSAAKLGATNLIGIEPFPFNSDRNDDNPFLANASRQLFRNKLAEFPKIKAMVVDAYLENTIGLNGVADIVTIFDVLEHAPSLKDVLSAAYHFLKPDGLLLISTAPYYWSSQGHHLFAQYPDEKIKWAHLQANSDRDLFEAEQVVRWRREAYQSLSQVTHDEIKSTLIELNFKIEKENVVTDPNIESLEESSPNFKRSAPNYMDYLITLGQFVVRRPKDQSSGLRAFVKNSINKLQ
jgi:2-polyprenyl-3-methyl-5-hydroxy-6-metoxy-1,4-benzoquinol methylase